MHAPSLAPTHPPSRVPAWVLVFLAPLLAEVLPGATRLSSMFVLPVEMGVWGGGALLIREAARHWRLGWGNVLALGLALAVAEECIIQQTSLAPMVLQLKGQVYARAFGVNYVYLLWALVYETVFVVFLPIQLAELIFFRRREERWLGRAGLIAAPALFLLGSFLAWFSWTRVARPQVFHVAAFTPPLAALLVATSVIGGLAYAAIGADRRRLAAAGGAPLTPPPPWLVGLAGGLWATLWYGLVLLGFGIAPTFPPAIAVGAGGLLAGAILYWVPRWSASPGWGHRHRFSVVFGTTLGAMLVSFIGFIGSAPMDLYFKIVANALAVGFLLVLGRRLRAALG